MVDFAAGVRVTARHCFMLETISVHVRPSTISVKGASDVEDVKKKKSISSAGRIEEVQFADDMWSALVHKGHISGDERWILGEDEAGRITVVRF